MIPIDKVFVRDTKGRTHVPVFFLDGERSTESRREVVVERDESDESSFAKLISERRCEPIRASFAVSSNVDSLTNVEPDEMPSTDPSSTSENPHH